jgi:hypothetical protein
VSAGGGNERGAIAVRCGVLRRFQRTSAGVENAGKVIWADLAARTAGDERCSSVLPGQQRRPKTLTLSLLCAPQIVCPSAVSPHVLGGRLSPFCKSRLHHKAPAAVMGAQEKGCTSLLGLLAAAFSCVMCANNPKRRKGMTVEDKARGNDRIAAPRISRGAVATCMQP